MTLASAVVSLLLAALLVYSALRKLGGQERVVRTYTRVGVPEDTLKYLAMLLLAGAAGLLLGLLWAPVGVAAAAGLVAYFLVAVAFHLRAQDAQHLPTPLTMALLAGAALALRLAAP